MSQILNYLHTQDIYSTLEGFIKFIFRNRIYSVNSIINFSRGVFHDSVGHLR